jgi:hypothetical protein
MLLIQTNLTSSITKRKWIPLVSTKPGAVLPCGFLQVPAADR